MCNWRGLAFYNVVLHQRTAVWPSCKETRTWLWLKPCLCLFCLFHIFLLISGKSCDSFIVTFIRERDVHIFKCSVALHGLRLWLKLQSYWALSLRIHVLRCDILSFDELFWAFWKCQGVPLSFTFNYGGTIFLQTSGVSNIATQHNNLEDLNPQHLHCVNLKSCTVLRFQVMGEFCAWGQGN